MQILFISILMTNYEVAVRDGVHETWQFKCNGSRLLHAHSHSVFMLQKPSSQVARVSLKAFTLLSP